MLSTVLAILKRTKFIIYGYSRGAKLGKKPGGGWVNISGGGGPNPGKLSGIPT